MGRNTRPGSLAVGRQVFHHYGDEAFARRDRFLAGETDPFKPEHAPILGSRIVARLGELGWRTELNLCSGDYREVFRACRGDEALTVAIKRGDRWALAAARERNHGGVSEPIAQFRTKSVGECEQWLLAQADIDLTRVFDNAARC